MSENENFIIRNNFSECVILTISTIRSQSVGAAEGVVGHSGWGSAEETAREHPSPWSAAEETQSTLSVALQEPGKILLFWWFCVLSATVRFVYCILMIHCILLHGFCTVVIVTYLPSPYFSRRALSREKRCAKPAQKESPSKVSRALVSSQSSSWRRPSYSVICLILESWRLWNFFWQVKWLWLSLCSIICLFSFDIDLMKCSFLWISLDAFRWATAAPLSRTHTWFSCCASLLGWKALRGQLFAYSHAVSSWQDVYPGLEVRIVLSFFNRINRLDTDLSYLEINSCISIPVFRQTKENVLKCWQIAVAIWRCVHQCEWTLNRACQSSSSGMWVL